MKQILITGFEAFGNSTLNPSAEIVLAMSGESIMTAILPVVFGKSAQMLRGLIDEYDPDFVLCLGQAEGRKALTLERVAINLEDTRMADNSGIIVTEQPVNKAGPAAYFSTLPIKVMTEAINTAGVPATISLSAGTFVCNHVFYSLQDYVKTKPIMSGFMHVPLMDQQGFEFADLPTMSLEQMIVGVKAALQVL